MRLPIAREGWPFILGAAVVTAVTSTLAFPWGAAALLAVIFFALFFRDPERAVPADPMAVVAPADGRVVDVAQVPGGEQWRVSIFMSPANVHVNRAPVDGKVAEVVRTRGKYLAAYRPEAGEMNNRVAMLLETGDGSRVQVVQVAGVLARRIVCRAKEGEYLRRGDRFGLIMFGSRVDLYMPRAWEVNARVGQRVRAGTTTVGKRYELSEAAAAI